MHTRIPQIDRRAWLKLSGASAAAVAFGAYVATSDAGPVGDSVTWLDCSFGPVHDRQRVRLLLMIVGNRIERGVVEPLGMQAVDVSRLRIGGGRITGHITIAHDPILNSRSIPRTASRMPITLDLTITGTQIRGTFSGTWPKNAKSTIDGADVKGDVIGTRRDQDRLRADNTLAAGAVWPSYVGPNQNFSCGATQRALVEDLNQARLVWASEYVGPTESGSKRYGACVGMPGCAGGASPVVANGRVFQFRYQPTGKVYQRHLDDQLAGKRGPEYRQRLKEIGWTEADLQRRWAIDADEELICIDAVTGRTLWTTAWRGEGLHLYDHKDSLTNHTGVFHDGKMFVFGALGIVRAVEAATGKTLWATDVPGYSALMRKMKATALERRDLSAPSRSFCHGLNVAGNTIIAPDGIGMCGLVGLDANTGKAMWRVPGVLGKEATPLTWIHDGRPYVIAANENGLIACIDSANGKTLWRFENAGNNRMTPLLVGDRLIAHKLRGTDREKVRNVEDSGAPFSAPGENYGQVACWRLTPKGFERAWEAPAEWGAPWDCPIGSASGNLICFRGRYSYYLVDVTTGRRLARHHLPTPVRWDEGHMLALPGMFVLHPDSQHGHTKMFALPARAEDRVRPIWSPPHPHATTYQVAMSHAWADGRLFIRGCDALYCYDLRRPI